MNNNLNISKTLLLDIVPSVSLTVTRSLGKAGHYVAGTSHENKSQPFKASKYSGKIFGSPDPHETELYIRFLSKFLLNHNFDVLLPLSEPTLKALSLSRGELASRTNFMIPEEVSTQISLSKRKTLEFAQSIKMPIPRTLFPESLKHVEYFAEKLKKFPLVIKGEHGGHVSRIAYARSPEELVYKYKTFLDRVNSSDPARMPIIQEYIAGKGVGYFGLYHRGVEKAFFMHERVLEYPITGGPSSIAKSIYDQELRDLGSGFLTALAWTGLAMVEFKYVTTSKSLVLMEINPRPWGSMALPVSLGIDFPLWSVELALGIKNTFNTSYPLNRNFIWLFPNTMLNISAQPSIIPRFLLSLLGQQSKTDLELRDLKPLLHQISLYFWYIKTLRTNTKSLRYPQGNPYDRKSAPIETQLNV